MSDQTDLFISEQTTDKLQGIIDAIAALQLQVDLQRSALIEILGGEPALQSQTLNIEGHIPIYDSSGKLISGSSLSHLSGETFTQALRVGTGPAIAGATALINGALVVGDRAGGKVAEIDDTGYFEPGRLTYRKQNITASDLLTINFSGNNNLVLALTFMDWNYAHCREVWRLWQVINGSGGVELHQRTQTNSRTLNLYSPSQNVWTVEYQVSGTPTAPGPTNRLFIEAFYSNNNANITFS